MAFVGKFKYTPSKELLEKLFTELILTRTNLYREAIEINKELQVYYGHNGGIVEDDYTQQAAIDNIQARNYTVQGKLDFVNCLLGPFERASREFEEQQKKIECDKMMAL